MMTTKPFDVKERDRARFAYLKALYDTENREKTDLGTIIMISLEDALTTTGLTALQAERAIADLENAGLIQAMGGMHYALTDYGREQVENHLSEEHRPWHDKIRAKLGSPAIVGGVAGFIASLVVNLLSASDMPWWLKLLMGKK
jgi:hypothetical protein